MKMNFDKSETSKHCNIHEAKSVLRIEQFSTYLKVVKGDLRLNPFLVSIVVKECKPLITLQVAVDTRKRSATVARNNRTEIKNKIPLLRHANAAEKFAAHEYQVGPSVHLLNKQCIRNCGKQFQ